MAAESFEACSEDLIRTDLSDWLMVMTRAQKAQIGMSSSEEENMVHEIMQIKEDITDLKSMKVEMHSLKGEMSEIKRILMAIGSGIAPNGDAIAERREQCSFVAEPVTGVGSLVSSIPLAPTSVITISGEVSMNEGVVGSGINSGGVRFRPVMVTSGMGPLYTQSVNPTVYPPPGLGIRYDQVGGCSNMHQFNPYGIDPNAIAGHG